MHDEKTKDKLETSTIGSTLGSGRLNGGLGTMNSDAFS